MQLELSDFNILGGSRLYNNFNIVIMRIIDDPSCLIVILLEEREEHVKATGCDESSSLLLDGDQAVLQQGLRLILRPTQ